MARQKLLTEAQRKAFYELPKHISDRDVIRYYTLSDEELRIIRQQRGAVNRLGFAIQIAYLRFPGRPLASGEKIPEYLVGVRQPFLLFGATRQSGLFFM